MFAAIGALMPPRPGVDSTKAGEALHEEGALEALATEAGLNPEEAGYIELVESYPNLETLLRGVMAAPPMVRMQGLCFSWLAAARRARMDSTARPPDL